MGNTEEGLRRVYSEIISAVKAKEQNKNHGGGNIFGRH